MSYVRRASVEKVNGYYLPDMFSVIVPEGTTNLITNPSLETNTTGYTAVGGSIARSAAEQRRGAYSLAVTPSGVNTGAYYGTVSLTAGTTYTASVDILGVKGVTYKLSFGTTAGVLIGGTATVKGNGHWRRVSITYQEDSTTTRRIYILAADGTNVYYIDGLQLEAKSYPTTYADGDMTGYVIGETAYSWAGTAHASTSTRASTTRSGGRLIPLKEYNFKLFDISGLGLPPVNNYAVLSQLGGATYTNTVDGVRGFILAGDISGPSLQALHQQRAAMESVLRQDVTPYRQPLALHWQQFDVDGEPLSDEVIIKCLYQGGLEQVLDNEFTERIALSFTAYEPEFEVVGSGGAAIFPSVEAVNAINTAQVDENRFFSHLKFGEEPLDVYTMNGSLRSSGNIGIFKYNSADGMIYVGGSFTHINGVIFNNVAIFDPATNIWTQMGTGTNDTIGAIEIFNGDVYIGGRFTVANGVPCNYVSKWNGFTFEALGTGTNTFVTCLRGYTYSSVDYMLVGGFFTTAGGVTCNYIARYNLTAGTWAALGDGTVKGANNVVTDISEQMTVSAKPVFVFGGLFTTVGNPTTGTYTANSIAIYNPEGATVHTSTAKLYPADGVGTGGITGGVQPVVWTIKVVPGTTAYYVGGDFTLASGVAISYTCYKADVTTGAFVAGDTVNGIVYKIEYGYYGTSVARLYGGAFSSFNSTTCRGLAAKVGSSTSYIYNPGLNSGAVVFSIAPVGTAGNMYIAGTFNTYFPSGLRDVVEYSEYRGRLRYQVDGLSSGFSTFAQAFSNDKIAYIDDLPVGVSQAAILNFARGGITFKWNNGVNIMRYFLPGSDPDLSVMPGDNTIGVLVRNSYVAINDGSSQLTYYDMITGLDDAGLTTIYVSITYSAPNYAVNIYSDSGRTQLIAHTANYTAAGLQALIEDNSSGVGGYIQILAASAADSDIEVTFYPVVVSWSPYVYSLGEAVY